MNNRHGGEGTNRFHPFGSHFSRLQQEAQDWSTVLLGGYAIGPMAPAALIQAWKQLLWHGGGQRVSVYVTTKQKRTVYLVGPDNGEAPGGLELENNTVTLCGVDERGEQKLIQGLPCRSVRCYLFVANTHRLLN